MSLFFECKNLSYSYPADEGAEPKKAVDDVSLQIEEGSFVAILGHNGSGKSTLAKLLSMVMKPNTGELVIDGKNYDIDNITDDDIIDVHKKVGMVFQNPDNQIVATIVEEDVAFGVENLGVETSEIRKRVDEALETVGMKEYAHSAVSKLSGGQKQRVAIAGALAMKRKCIIFDESTAMLDPKGRKEVISTIQRLNKEENMTVILITHYMNEAVLADKVLIMNHGKLAMSGTPSEIFSNPKKIWNLGLDVPQGTELLYNLKNELGLNLDTSVFNPDECAKQIADSVR